MTSISSGRTLRYQEPMVQQKKKSYTATKIGTGLGVIGGAGLSVTGAISSDFVNKVTKNKLITSHKGVIALATCAALATLGATIGAGIDVIRNNAKKNKTVPKNVEEVSNTVEKEKPNIYLTKEEMKLLLDSCEEGRLNGKPIKNYKTKIIAVLNNPEEVEAISEWKDKPHGIWRAIQDPLPSTREMYPELFEI